MMLRVFVCAGVLTMVASAGAQTSLVSRGNGEVVADGLSRFPVISGDNRWLIFSSDATNLVPGDGNGATDVFVRDLHSGAVARVSVSSSGVEGNGPSGHVNHTRGHAISHDGRFIVFYSAASNLVTGDGNGTWDLFFHDRDPDGNGAFDSAGTTQRINLGPGGVEADAITGPHGIDITDDGRWVVYYSEADNLVADDGNGFGDCFLWDRDTGATTRVSVGEQGEEGDRAALHPVITPDGRFIGFYHISNAIVPGDANNETDVFLRDRDPDENGVFDDVAPTVEIVSLADDESQGTLDSRYAWVSDDGRYVAFESAAPNLVADDDNDNRDIFVRDRQLGATVLATRSDAGDVVAGGGRYPFMLSADGGAVTYRGFDDALVTGDDNNRQDVLVYDVPTGDVQRVSLGAGDTQLDGHSTWMWISDDNRYVAFESFSTNAFGPGSTSGWLCYVYDRGPQFSAIAADVTGDGAVNFDDLNLVLSRWGMQGPGGDADGSGTVDFGDLNDVLAGWGG